LFGRLARRYDLDSDHRMQAGPVLARSTDHAEAPSGAGVCVFDRAALREYDTPSQQVKI